MTEAAFREHFKDFPFLMSHIEAIDFSQGCWEFANHARYPRLSHQGTHYFIHRLSLEIKMGAPLGGKFACHVCDNPPCVNPDHLFPGGYAENAADMVAKGRTGNKTHWGIENVKATLTDEEVGWALDRVQAGESYTSIARDLGISHRTVGGWVDRSNRAAAHDAWVARRIAAGESVDFTENLTKSHCKNGHPLVDVHVTDRGHRRCRVCSREAYARRQMALDRSKLRYQKSMPEAS